MPIGILVSLLVCTILYMLFAHVMTGVAHYSEFGGQQGIAPVAIAIEHMGEVDASGVLHPDYPWMNKAIVLAILFGYCSTVYYLRSFHISMKSSEHPPAAICCSWCSSVCWQLSFRHAWPVK